MESDAASLLRKMEVMELRIWALEHPEEAQHAERVAQAILACRYLRLEMELTGMVTC